MAEVPTSPNGGGSYDESGDQSPRANVREQDRFLPIANISRIMKKALPANGKIAKDAKETVQECVSEFISFITSEASDKCQREKRKTINGDDLLWAMATLGFEDYIDPLKIYLARYREMEGDTKGSAKGGESSAKKDVQPSPNAQIAHQGSFSQGVNYATSQSLRLALVVEFLISTAVVYCHKMQKLCYVLAAGCLVGKLYLIMKTSTLWRILNTYAFLDTLHIMMRFRKLVVSKKQQLSMYMGELLFSALVLSCSPKSDQVWSHRRWVI